ncbi:MAG: hypothetical protein QXN71_02290 [Candidatus Aenigmatarchaeota archaeon]
MGISRLLIRNIIETDFGGIINKFKISKRRDVLFFEEILAKYIKKCELAGYKKEMMDAAREWGFLYVKNFMPKIMENAPKNILFNRFLKRVWIELGLLEEFRAEINGNEITFITYDEAITRHTGENEFCKGLWEGVLSGIYRCKAETIYAEQSPVKSVYNFRLTHLPFSVKSKSKTLYLRLNTFRGKGELKKYIKAHVLVLKGNRMTFRGKSVVIGENTLFHIFGTKKILINIVSEISSCFLDEIIEKDSSFESKINLLKNILQVFGWGKVKIVYSRERIDIEIQNPPYGIQSNDDNWIFLSHFILGYLLLTDRRCRLSEINQLGKSIRISYKTG